MVAKMLLFLLAFWASGGLSNPIFLLPAQFRGDFNPFIAVGDELLAKGHEIYVILPEEFRHWVDETRYHYISSGPSVMTDEEAVKFFLENYQMDFLAMAQMMAQLEAQIRKYALPEMARIIKEVPCERGSAVLLTMAYPTIGDLAEALNIPYILFISQGPSIPFDFSFSMNPLPAGYYPFFGSEKNELETFSDRWWNSLMFYGFYYLAPIVACQDRIPVREELSLPPLSLSSCYFSRPKAGSMSLYPTVIGLSRPSYFSPTVHFLGTVYSHYEPNTQYDEILNWVQEAPFPVVYASFSTCIDLPKEVLVMVLETMSKMKQFRFLWSLRDRSRVLLPPDEEIPSHVKIVNWVKQIDVFKSKKVVATIVTGGANGIQEALYHGSLPILCIPVMVEQSINCYNAARFGAGIRISKYDITSPLLEDSLLTLVTDPTFKRKAEDLSILLHAGGGAPRGAQLLESVALIGNNNHAIPKAFYLPDWQALNLDVIGSLLLLLLIVIGGVCGCLTWGCRRIRRFNQKKVEAKSEKSEKD